MRRSAHFLLAIASGIVVLGFRSHRASIFGFGALPSSQENVATTVRTPNFSGKWHLEHAENLKAFMAAIDYNFFLREFAGLAKVTQVIDQSEGSFTFQFGSFPAMVPTRIVSFRLDDDEVSMLDDGGREMVLSRPQWDGEVLRAFLRYRSPVHELEIMRYIESGKMVEHVRHLEKDVEMRRIFKKMA